MKFEFKKFGFVDSGSIELADLTILCGPNNVGKTYVSYAIYGFIKNIFELSSITISKENLNELTDNGFCKIQLDEYTANIQDILLKAGIKFSNNLDTFFNVPQEFFSNSSISFNLEKYTPDFSQPFTKNIQFGSKQKNSPILRLSKASGESILNVVLQDAIDIPIRIIQNILAEQITEILLFSRLPRPFVITSERTGISLFYKELDISKNAILEHISDNDKVNPLELLNKLRSRYAEPIKDNIDIIRDYDTLNKRKSFIKNDKDKYNSINEVLKKLVGGVFKTVNKQVMYQPQKERNRNLVALPVYIASSSIKSLFLFDYYINCLASPGDILIIDEPELNLHPNNQRLMASLLSRLVNSGIKILFTTHSDFLVKEINNRIMLSQLSEEPRSLFCDNKKFTPEDVLNPEQVKAYTIGIDHKIQQIKSVDGGWLDMEIFDTEIAASNELADDIYYSLDD